MCWLLIFFNVYPVLMYGWLLVFYLVGVNGDSSSEINEPSYECGRHGRFEYCINGIPGCVVGCHCYPGYYFDTEAKICEPNIKLIQSYRRQYNLPEPTRLPMSHFAPMANSPTTTPSNPIDEKVDAIAKDTDDLGDWLYNQFFKTIENQVINSTDDEKETRRSGSQVAKPIPRSLKRSRKRGKKNKSKKKKYKKKGLRRKLLRITEDDSLFDSSSGSSSEETSSSYSSSSSSESDTSSDKDEKHGHRKILMINKKATPQLPSFIFLPNVETPFYPPIGLPPPPIVPMYPMVPVPPYYPGYCNDSETTSAPTTKSLEVTTNSPTTTAITSVDPDPDPDPGPDPNPSPDANPDPNPGPGPDPEPSVRARETNGRNKKARKPNKHGERNNLMQKYREKLKKRNKRPPPTDFMNNFQDLETPFLNNPEPPPDPIQFRSRDMYDPVPPMEDVDFKYLSQLIHKIDLNKTKPSMPLKLKQRVIDLPNRQFRRNYLNTSPIPYDLTQKMRPASKADDINDSYYSNLGRQIATLIRKVDTDGEHQINIEIEQQNQDPMQTIFNQNRYAPRSYWERFARSPLKLRQNFIQENNHLKNSNENLFNLEDQVSLATAIERSLSLQELENIANIMERTQSKRRQKSSKYLTPPTSSRSYNINLLPRLDRRANTVIQVNDKKAKQMNKVNQNRNILSTLDYNSYSTHPSHNAITSKKQINETHKNLSMPLENKYKLNFLNNLMQNPRKTPLHHQVSRIVHKNITNPKTVLPQQIMKYPLNPSMVNYKSVKYVRNNHNQYQSQHSLMPFQMPFFSKPAQSTGRSGRLSYFHHKLHHFDYFD